MPQAIGTGTRPPRAKMAQRTRVRPYNSHLPEEICLTQNVSRRGFYFQSLLGHYFAGMYVYVTRNFHEEDPMSREEAGDVVRVERLASGKWGVAVRILSAAGRR